MEKEGAKAGWAGRTDMEKVQKGGTRFEEG